MKKILFLLPLVFLASCGETTKHFPVNAGVEAELNHCLKLSSQKKFDQAVDCLEVFKSRHPTDTQASQADLLIADSLFRKKEYLVAAESYQNFVKKYSYHPRLDYAYYQSGICYLKETPKSIDRDQQYLDLAVSNLGIVLKYFPNSSLAGKAQEQYQAARLKVAQRQYYIARFYYKFSEYRSASLRFEDIVRNYAGLGLDEKSYYYLIQSYLKTDQDDRAKQVLYLFESNYPRSNVMKRLRAQLMGKKAS